jgi:hypothetical protein
MPVLLKNKTRELRTYNVGDTKVPVERVEAAQTKSGQTGTRTVRRQVSSSVTLMPKGTPGDSRLVDGIILKQTAVKRDIDNGLLLAVEQKATAKAPEPPKVEVKVAPPLETTKTGAAPVQEEGKGTRPSRKRKATKETDG